MGVDSGLPDFRGTEGFWRAYPPMAKLNLRLEDTSYVFFIRLTTLVLQDGSKMISTLPGDFLDTVMIFTPKQNHIRAIIF